MAISLHDGMSAVRGQGGGCYAKSATLAALARTDISNFSKAVSRLIDFDYISREQQQSDKRRSTLRVIFSTDNSWRADQPPLPAAAGKIVGEPTNHHPEKLGEHTNQVVGEGDRENGGFLRKMPPHYISLSEELNSEESEEKDSVETAHRTFGATRRDDPVSVNECSHNQKIDIGKAELGRNERVSISTLLPRRFNELATEAQLSSFERAFSDLGRDANAIEPKDREWIDSWLFAIADARAGDEVGYRAQRLYEEVG